MPLLPFRVRNYLDQRRIDRAVSSVLSSPAMSCNRADDADFEVHILLRRCDVRCAILALKSLLRFKEVKTAVTITDDGSLRNRDKKLVDSHIGDVRWLPRYSIDNVLASALEPFPHLNALYRTDFHMIAKLVHPIVLGRCEAMVAMDADVAFFDYPQVMIEWAKQPTAPGLYLHDSENRNKEVAWCGEMFNEVAAGNSQLFKRRELGHWFFNAGLLCYLRSACQLAAAEQFLKWRASDAVRRFDGANLASVWLGEWTREQSAYMCMFMAMEGQPLPLPDEYRIGGAPWGAFHHFLRSGLCTEAVQARLYELAKTITNK
jgi:hypothetical protein